MSHLRFEELTEKNIPDAIAVCNRSLRYDSFDSSVLRKIVFQDPNFEPGLAFVAYEDGEPVGFAAGVRPIRQPPEEVYPSATWIKILAGVAGKENDEVEVISALCSRIEVELRNLGGKVVRISDFMRSRLWPGIDLRYETILEALEKSGYSKVGEAVDYIVSLRGFSVPRRIQRLQEELGKGGIVITPATRAGSESLCRWVKGEFYPGWGYEVAVSIENAEMASSGTLVAKDIKNGEIIGFATHGALNRDWFGPIGVDEKRRKSGVGSVLLFESLRLMRLKGVVEAVIPWTDHLFFYTQVPGIKGIRHYHIMSKNI